MGTVNVMTCSCSRDDKVEEKSRDEEVSHRPHLEQRHERILPVVYLGIHLKIGCDAKLD